MTLYEAIYVRKTTRNFSMEPVRGELISSILEYEEELIPYNPDIQTKIEIIGNQDAKARLKGLLTVNAPYYLVLYSEKKEGCFLNAGYMMEQMALYLNSRGIGVYCLRNVHAKKGYDINENLHDLIILAFGLPKTELYKTAYSAKRLELSELCTFKSEIGSSMKAILEAARLAPSNMNLQPWRFVVYDNRVHVFMKKPPVANALLQQMAEFDIGMMLSHIMIAAEDLWIDISIKKLENINSKSIPNNAYVTSIALK